MPIYKGSAKVRTIYHGDTKIARIFKDIKVFGDYKTITKTVTINGTVVVPANVFRVDLLVIGGGGGGATSTFYHGNKWQGRAGASGAVCQSIFTGQAAKDLRGKTLTYTVGAGGVAGGGAVSPGPNSSGGRNGGDAGTSTLTGDEIVMSATGGKGGMGGWYNNGHAAVAGTATGGNYLNKNGYVAPYNASNVFAPTPSAWDNTITGWGAGGWQESYDGTIHAGVTGCVSWVFYVSE